MKPSIALLLILACPAAQAETITCTFTEPFITIIVNERTKMVAEQNFGRTTRRVRAARLTKNGRRTVVIYGRSRQGPTTLIYRRDGRGSDGMSEARYPYSGETFTGPGRHLYGGCESTREKRRMND